MFPSNLILDIYIVGFKNKKKLGNRLRPVNLESCQNHLWLLRVPEPLASIWMEASDGTKLGDLYTPNQVKYYTLP